MGSILQKYTVIDIVKRIVQLKALKIDNGYPIRYHIWISPKNDISWWNRRLLEMENSLKPGDDHMGQVFCLRHGGFDRISAGCRARDRVGPKGGSRWSAFSHFVGYFFFHIFSPDGAMRQLHCHFGFQARLSDFGFKRTGCLNFFPLLTWAILSGSVVEKFRPS